MADSFIAAISAIAARLIDHWRGEQRPQQRRRVGKEARADTLNVDRERVYFGATGHERTDMFELAQQVVRVKGLRPEEIEVQ
jgi:hypothetical protein